MNNNNKNDNVDTSRNEWLIILFHICWMYKHATGCCVWKSLNHPLQPYASAVGCQISRVKKKVASEHNPGSNCISSKVNLKISKAIIVGDSVKYAMYSTNLGEVQLLLHWGLIFILTLQKLLKQHLHHSVTLHQLKGKLKKTFPEFAAH